jgi:hypothetical protein
MWVMVKKIKGREYVYLYRSVWRDGRPRNQFIRYLGPKDTLSEQEVKRIIKAEEENKEKI